MFLQYIFKYAFPDCCLHVQCCGKWMEILEFLTELVRSERIIAGYLDNLTQRNKTRKQIKPVKTNP